MSNRKIDIIIEIGGIQHPPVTYYGTLDTPLLHVFHEVTRQLSVQVLFKVKPHVFKTVKI